MKIQGFQLFIVCLLIFSCKTPNMVTKKQEPDELSNAKYKVVSLRDYELNDQKITLSLNVNDKFMGGNASCNDYQFKFDMNGKEITMKPGISTKMYCQEKMETERKFMGLMSQVKFIAQSDENLYLKDSENKLLIKAKKRESSRE